MGIEAGMDSVRAGLDALGGGVLAQGALTYLVISLLWPLAWVGAVEVCRRVRSRRQRPEAPARPGELARSTASIAALAQHVGSARHPFLASSPEPATIAAAEDYQEVAVMVRKQA